jgi:hypothetical protein
VHAHDQHALLQDGHHAHLAQHRRRDVLHVGVTNTAVPGNLRREPAHGRGTGHPVWLDKRLRSDRELMVGDALDLYAVFRQERTATSRLQRLARETFLATSKGKMGPLREGLYSLLSRNARAADAYLKIPPTNVVESGAQYDL